MADVRALLKAKRAEARIVHPYAAYTPAGALRCTACSAGVRHAGAWEGHLGSKAHRVAVARARAAAAAEAEAAAAATSKRQAEEADEEMEGTPPPAKRQRTAEREAQHPSGAFPADFFSDPARAPPPRDDDDDDEMDADDDNAEGSKPPATQFDREWAAFEAELAARPAAADPQETYARATVAAEPALAPALVGLPAAQEQTAAEEEKPPSEEEARRRRKEEEHELIMDRLLEEERAQEEADGRVVALKSRFELLKKKRERARGKKAEART
ncbi:hypothetical protein BC834DRAFT_973893 [Gloeopeniophorella convolvens]|nr:hypothetical protein BC834DRAFT_973893 [Gloeopeniophorella convolvens]